MFTPFNSNLKSKAKGLRKNQTPAEKKLWFEFLRIHPKHKFLRQKPIGNYIVDFYCADQKLVIEIDGDSHFTGEGVKKDLKRDYFLENENSIKVIRFTNAEVVNNFEGICEEFERALSLL